MAESYIAHVRSLKEWIEQLETIRRQVPEELLASAQTALAEGNTQKADRFLEQIENEALAMLKVAGEAAFHRGNIALNEVRYQEALEHFKHAVQRVPENGAYLNNLGLVEYVLGRHHTGSKHLERALAIDLKTHDKEHPAVANIRGALGVAWQRLGEYETAIESYEQALPILESHHGADDRYAIYIRENLSVARGEMNAEAAASSMPDRQITK